jgi:hypothetical protein
MRLIYALQLELEPDPDKPGSSRTLIAWLDAEGNSRFARPLAKWKRIADVRRGDWIRHCGTRYQLRGVEPYRSHEVPADYVPSGQQLGDGFLAD